MWKVLLLKVYTVHIIEVIRLRAWVVNGSLYTMYVTEIINDTLVIVVLWRFPVCCHLGKGDNIPTLGTHIFWETCLFVKVTVVFSVTRDTST